MRGASLVPALLAALVLALPLGSVAKHFAALREPQQEQGTGGQEGGGGGGGGGGGTQGQTPVFSALAAFSGKRTAAAATSADNSTSAYLRQPKDKCSGVRCPDKSKCTFLGGAPICKCPSGQRFMAGYKCKKANLRYGSYLDPHNNARAAVGSPMLHWDYNLASYAQKWVKYLASKCTVEIGGYPAGAGQNVANVRNTDAPNDQAVGFWVSQGSKYSYAKFDDQAAGCSTGRWTDCGAYTQVVWSNTRFVGCASLSCPGQAGRVWACNYSPAGNVIGEYPYPLKRY